MKRKLFYTLHIASMALVSLSGCSSELKSLTFSKSYITLQEDSTYQITFKEKVDISLLSFDISSPNIISISDTGLINGLNRGTVYLTASYKTLETTCEVKVTANPERSDVSLASATYTETLTNNDGNFSLSAPIEFNYYSKNGLFDYGNLRFDSVMDYFDKSLTKEQIKDNITMLAIKNDSYHTLKDMNSDLIDGLNEEDIPETDLTDFGDKMFDMYMDTKNLSGEALSTYVSSLKEEIEYRYVSDPYQASGYISENIPDYYSYKNGGDGSLQEMSKYIGYTMTFLDYTSIDIEDLSSQDIIDLLELAGVDTSFLDDSGEDLDEFVNILKEGVVFNKTNNASQMTSTYTFELTEKGLEELNKRIQNNLDENTPEKLKELAVLSKFKIEMKKNSITKQLKQFTLTEETGLGEGVTDITINNIRVIEQKDAFRYYSLHPTFENYAK